ncbi:unnamed protein product, partial [Musa textilis]
MGCSILLFFSTISKANTFFCLLMALSTRVSFKNKLSDAGASETTDQSLSPELIPSAK